jgi:hypothetical protein
MHTMKRTVAHLFAAVTALLVSQVALAGHADTIQAALTDARSNLVSMIDTADKAAQDGFHVKVAKASKDVDAGIEAALKDPATTADQAGKYKEFKATWEAFKNTRENEIVPAVRAGKTADAKAVAGGIQAERMKKMKGLLSDLGAK